MRKKRLSLNTMSSLLLEVATTIYGLILPSLIIRNYGSEVNGLVNSIRQFLSIITFFEFGIGAVIRTALYKPLALSDKEEVDRVISSAIRFFRKLGFALLAYVVILTAVFPMISKGNFDRIYISVLVIILSSNSFAQYFIGCVDGIFLNADQHGYIQSTTQIITISLSTIVGAVLINMGFGIHIIQLAMAVIYVLRPVLIRIYVKRHYAINYNAKYDKEPVAQKWNGVAQHVAAIILESTDIIVLTAFASLSDVSVYSVYYLVIRGLKQIFNSVSQGFQALFGEFYAKNDDAGMQKTFDLMEWFYGTFTTFVYGCASFLIIPFVSVYTLNIEDANYAQPLFAVLMVIAFWLYNNNAPYHIAILAAGHYRETQFYFIVAAIINIILSVVTVNLFGLIGVAFGTLVAMLYQTTWMVIYNAKRITKRSIKRILRQFTVDGVVILISTILSSFVNFEEVSWIGWIIMGIKTAIIWGVVSCMVNFAVYRKKMISFIKNRK